MTHYLFQRHYLADQNGLNELKEGVNEILNAMYVDTNRSKPRFKFGLKLTVPEDRLLTLKPDCSNANQFRASLSIVREARKLAAEFMSLGGHLIYDPEDKGAGTSYRQIVFNQMFLSQPNDTSLGAVLCLDMDQFPIGTPEALDAWSDIADKVIRDELLYANGSRRPKIVLGLNPEASAMREVDELFNSGAINLAAGKNILSPGGRPQTPSTAYHVIGENTSGGYVFNPNHPSFKTLVLDTTTVAMTADMSEFATDYFLAIRALELSPMTVAQYVPSVSNKLYGGPTLEQEIEGLVRGKRGIVKQNGILGQTRIRSLVLNALDNKHLLAVIKEHYDSEIVERVRSWKRESLQ